MALSSCGAIPIVLRASTLEYVPPTTRKLAAFAAGSQGVPVYAVTCSFKPRLNLTSGAVSIGLGGHNACNETWAFKHLFNPNSRARLAPMLPMWGAVEILTAAAMRLILPLCSSRRRTGAGCTAFVIDPDVFLPPVLGIRNTVRAACEYYDATRYDAVLLFAAPPARFSVDDSYSNAGHAMNEAINSSTVARLMGSRHVSFLTVRAISALAALTRRALPTYTADKGLDMLLPNLLPAADVSVLWLLEGCGAFQSLGSRGGCRARGLSHLNPTRQFACTTFDARFDGEETPSGDTAQPAWDPRHAPPLPPPSRARPSPPLLSRAHCELGNAGLSLWDAFLYMLPNERASEHVCMHLECLPPAATSGPRGLRHLSRLNLNGPALHTELCRAGRGTTRRMPLLSMSAGGVAGRLRRFGRANITTIANATAAISASGEVLATAEPEHLIGFLSVHLQGNAKGACLQYILSSFATPSLNSGQQRPLAQRPAQRPAHRPAQARPPPSQRGALASTTVDEGRSLQASGSRRARADAIRAHALRALAAQRSSSTSHKEHVRGGRQGRRGGGGGGVRWWVHDWSVETRSGRRVALAPLCLGDVTIVVMGSSAMTSRLKTVRETWARGAFLVHFPMANSSAIGLPEAASVQSMAGSVSTASSAAEAAVAAQRPRLLIMSDRENATSAETTTEALKGRTSYWDAQVIDL